MLNPRITLLASIIALGAAGAALAQEAAAPTPETPAQSAPEAATTEAAPAETSAPEAAAQPAVEDNAGYVAATFEAWQQRCIKTDTGADPCQLYTLLKDADGNNVAEFTLFNLPDGTPGQAVAGANFIAPLETLLPEGVRLTIDTAAPMAYPFAVCSQVGCVSRVGFTKADVTALKKGANATFTIVPYVAPDQQVQLQVSLKGFTAGYDAMVAQNKKADAAALANQKSAN